MIQRIMALRHREPGAVWRSQTRAHRYCSPRKGPKSTTPPSSSISQKGMISMSLWSCNSSTLASRLCLFEAQRQREGWIPLSSTIKRHSLLYISVHHPILGDQSPSTITLPPDCLICLVYSLISNYSTKIEQPSQIWALLDHPVENPLEHQRMQQAQRVDRMCITYALTQAGPATPKRTDSSYTQDVNAIIARSVVTQTKILFTLTKSTTH